MNIVINIFKVAVVICLLLCQGCGGRRNGAGHKRCPGDIPAREVRPGEIIESWEGPCCYVMKGVGVCVIKEYDVQGERGYLFSSGGHELCRVSLSVNDTWAVFFQGDGDRKDGVAFVGVENTQGREGMPYLRVCPFVDGSAVPSEFIGFSLSGAN